MLQYLVRAITGSAGAFPTCSRAALPRWGSGFLVGDQAISSGVPSFCLNTHVAFLKWSTSLQGPCRACNLFSLQWWYGLKQFTRVTWRYLSFSAVCGAERTSAYCSTKKTCSYIHTGRSWHHCRALLELPGNAGVCPCKMNSSMSLLLGKKQQKKQQFSSGLEWSENHYLPLHQFQLFITDISKHIGSF